jgi:small subunit ribosomal protein S2
MNTHTVNTVDTAKIERLFSVGAHFGVGKSRRHPSQKENIFAQKDALDVFDLSKTQKALEKAMSFAQKMGEEGKFILFVGGKPESAYSVRTQAIRVDAPYSVNRWIGGTLTNKEEIRRRTARLEKLRYEKESGGFEKYTKLERVLLDREIKKLETMYEGLLPLGGLLPHCLFVIDPKSEDIAIREALKVHIPIIALSSSDCDISSIDYPIPANDATLKSISFFTEMIAQAYQNGKLGIKKKVPEEKEKNA